MGKIIYGSEVSAELREELRLEVEELKQEGKRIPKLAVILAGDNPASLSYVRGKAKACEAAGILEETFHLAGSVSQEELEDLIHRCNEDPVIDGILLQLPLPAGLDENHAIEQISPEKDVDGLHPLNFGKVHLGIPAFVPCTPLGIMELLNRMGCDCDGKNAVVVGRSKLVGEPAARLLLNANATVTICHSHTKNLKEICRNADILIAAVGKPCFFNHEYVKEGAYVIDVGINRMADGHLRGDVDFEDVKDLCAAITPVPKGVGPMTITMLLENTMKAYREAENESGGL
ncbi:MAG: bifunctional methylenetetrahydrofolate dehydrogenase/methenyltetrahydrofolate cyclohydrolase FolD [Anaerolactibacter massiliensis]|nr:bifunctional methylenetetrahydrofolate dehydrogenase/methenyltetrahydrofolate cyclohydrolase FolD [Anaerolactibacter massiliensis]